LITRFPISLTVKTAGYMIQKKLKRVPKYPIVLMLEPLHACNLSCQGCGRIREYKDTVKEQMRLQDCLNAIDESGAPIISICGGEPLIYPEMGTLVKETLKRKKHIYFCTNGVFLKKKLNEYTPTNSFIFNVHLDGMEKTHDLIVERQGTFAAAVEGIKAAVAAGFLVCTNTTVYAETDMEEIDQLFAYLKGIGVSGFMIAPGYEYSSVAEKDLFLDRKMVREKFKNIDQLNKKYRILQSPVFLDFLRGKRELECTAWGNPTRNIAGWKSPCYLITDTHYSSMKELYEKTDWTKIGPGHGDPRCENCLSHVGFETTAALGTEQRLSDIVKMAKWQLF